MSQAAVFNTARLLAPLFGVIRHGTARSVRLDASDRPQIYSGYAKRRACVAACVPVTAASRYPRRAAAEPGAGIQRDRSGGAFRCPAEHGARRGEAPDSGRVAVPVLGAAAGSGG